MVPDSSALRCETDPAPLFASTGVGLWLWGVATAITTLLSALLGLVVGGPAAGLLAALLTGTVSLVAVAPLVVILGGTADTHRAVRRAVGRRRTVRARQNDRRAGTLALTPDTSSGALSALPTPRDR